MSSCIHCIIYSIINLLFHHKYIVFALDSLNNNNFIISGPTEIDQCGSVYLNVFSSFYQINENDNFKWKYNDNITTNYDNPELYISNNDLFNITNNRNNISIDFVYNNIYDNSISNENIMIEIDKSSIFPYIEIDGGNFHTIYVNSNVSSLLYTQSSTIFNGAKTNYNNNNYYHIISNAYHSQCLPSNENNITLIYEWKQLFNTNENNDVNISKNRIFPSENDEELNSKILSIPIDKLEMNKYYLFQLTVSQREQQYKTTKEILIYTEYPLPIPLATTIENVNNDDIELIISIYDLFYFQNEEMEENVYSLEWFCFDETNHENVLNPIDCSNIIQSQSDSEIIIDTISLSLNTKYRFQCVIDRNNKSVQSSKIYFIQESIYYEDDDMFNNTIVGELSEIDDNSYFDLDLELLSNIPFIINPFQTMTISICIYYDDHIDNNDNISIFDSNSFIWTYPSNLNNDNIKTELLISNINNTYQQIEDYKSIFNDKFDFIQSVSTLSSCSLQTNLYLNVVSMANGPEMCNFDMLLSNSINESSFSLNFTAQYRFVL